MKSLLFESPTDEWVDFVMKNRTQEGFAHDYDLVYGPVDNVHLLLPSKLSLMADMLAEDKNISIVEAIKQLYSSKVYSRLEKEYTKAWHLGAVALYEDFQAGV